MRNKSKYVETRSSLGVLREEIRAMLFGRSVARTVKHAAIYGTNRTGLGNVQSKMVRRFLKMTPPQRLMYIKDLPKMVRTDPKDLFGADPVSFYALVAKPILHEAFRHESLSAVAIDTVKTLRRSRHEIAVMVQNDKVIRQGIGRKGRKVQDPQPRKAAPPNVSPYATNRMVTTKDTGAARNLLGTRGTSYPVIVGGLKALAGSGDPRPRTDLLAAANYTRALAAGELRAKPAFLLELAVTDRALLSGLRQQVARADLPERERAEFVGALVAASCISSDPADTTALEQLVRADPSIAGAVREECRALAGGGEHRAKARMLTLTLRDVLQAPTAEVGEITDGGHGGL